MTSDAIADAGSPEAKGGADGASIGREMAKGGGWMIAARLGVQAIGFVSTIILARVLVPADFGLVALATTFAAALQAISEFSFDVVLIQNQRAGREHYDTAWTLSVIRNGILSALLLATAPLVAELLGDARLTPIVHFLAISNFLDGLQNIGIVDFRKHLAFHRELIFMVLGKLGMFVVTVPLAFLWHDYWALVGGLMAGAVVRLALSYLMHPFRPRPSLVHWREIMHFSKWLLANNICAFVFSRSDTFVLGKLAGAQAVGVYGIAFEIANLSTSNLVGPVRRAIFPGYSKVADDLEGLRKGFFGVLSLVLLIGAPMAVGIGAVAGPLVHVMLGEKWLASIPLIQILSLYSFIVIIGTSSAPIFLARARPQYIMWILGGSSVILIPLLLVGVWGWGAIGAAWAMTITAGVASSIDLWLAFRLLDLRIGLLIAAVWRPIVAAAMMVAAVVELGSQWPMPLSAVSWAVLLIVSILSGAMIYGISALALWGLAGWVDGAEKQILLAGRQAGRRVLRSIRS